MLVLPGKFIMLAGKKRGMLLIKATPKDGKRRHRSHNLIHEVEEIVGEKGDLLPALLALVAGNHTVQVNVQEGGL